MEIQRLEDGTAQIEVPTSELTTLPQEVCMSLIDPDEAEDHDITEIRTADNARLSIVITTGRPDGIITLVTEEGHQFIYSGRTGERINAAA